MSARTRARTRFFSCAAALVATTGLLSCESGGPPPVVLISIDTLRADHVGAYGYEANTTPHIDRLAREGIVFEGAFAHATSTLSSHASILTSRLPKHHGASIGRSTRLGEGAVSLAEVLRDAGYATASFNGGVQLDPLYGLDRGFDVYDAASPVERDSQVLAGPEHRTRPRVDAATAWIESIAGPFFLFLHSYEIHHPYTPDPEIMARFDRGYRGDLPDEISVKLLERINAGRIVLDDGDLAHIQAAYDAELHSADAAVGHLLDWLAEHDLYEDALIIVTSDHGEEFGEHGSVGWHAHTLFDELLHVPLIVKLPGAKHAGTRVGQAVRSIDIAPAVLDWIGVTLPESFDGIPLASAIDRRDTAPRDTISIRDLHPGSSHWSLRTEDWKLDWQKAPRLFDLERDPGEREDRSAARTDLVDALQAKATAEIDARPPPPPAHVAISPEHEELLRALGYVE